MTGRQQQLWALSDPQHEGRGRWDCRGKTELTMTHAWYNACFSLWQVKLTRVALGWRVVVVGYQLQCDASPGRALPVTTRAVISWDWAPATPEDSRSALEGWRWGGGERLSGITCIHSNNEVYSGPAGTQHPVLSDSGMKEVYSKW